MPAQAAIGDHGLIADGRAAALVAVDGTIDWACLPRFDHGACFSSLLDARRGGRCALAPEEPARAPEQGYRGDTLVLSTRHATAGGEATVHDLLVRTEDRPDAPARLVRVVDGEQGDVELELTVAPRFDYGLTTPWVRRIGRATYAATGGDDGLLVWTDGEWRHERGPVQRATIRVRAGERRRVVLTSVRPEELDDHADPEPPAPEQVDRWLDATAAWWQAWADRLDAGGDRALIRSALTLKALLHDRTGAMVAAPTTSLPETPDGHRTWDYRFAWIRDCTFAVRCLASAGAVEDADRFRRFVARTAAGDPRELRVVYGIGGERLLGEAELPQLDGWRGAGPVRVGNGASGQFQLDVYGDLLEQAHSALQRGSPPDDAVWPSVAGLADVAAERWREPDQGIWEWRDGRRPWTYSKVMAWVALDRANKLADGTGRTPRPHWARERDAVHAAVTGGAYDHDLKAFRATLEGEGLDAAVLRLPWLEFLPPDDARLTSTARVLAERLDDGGLLRRYDLDDSLPGREGVFLPCTFWLAIAHALAGRLDEASAAYERASATANHVGLFSEELDPRTGELLGNFPQALTHLSHLEAGLSLRHARERAG